MIGLGSDKNTSDFQRDSPFKDEDHDHNNDDQDGDGNDDENVENADPAEKLRPTQHHAP